MNNIPVLLRGALALSAVVGAAAPLSAQAISDPASKRSPSVLAQLPTAESSATESSVKSSVIGTSTIGASTAESPTTELLTNAGQDLAKQPLAQASPSPLPEPQAPAGDPPALPPGTTQPDLAPQPTDSGSPTISEPATPSSAESAPGLPVPTTPDAPAGESPLPSAAPQPTAEEATPERQVLVAEVLVEGAEGELVDKVYEAIATRPGQSTTRSQLQVDINAIFATGFFSAVRAEPTDTPLGVRVTFIVQPNPILRSVQPAGNQVLTQAQVDEIFQPQYGKTLNLRELQAGIQAINKFYQDKGYVLGQVAGSPQIDADGTVTLQVAEGVIENIDVRYKNKEGEAAKGRTRKFIITRELRTKPGDVLNRDSLQADLRRVFALGLFEDVQVALEPGEDPRKVVVNLNVQERKTGSFSAGAGFSSNSGLFGTGSYSQNNFGGNNQKLSTQLQIGTREFLFDASFTDPWIATDPYRTSYTVNVFNRLTRPLVFDGGETDVNLGIPDATQPDGFTSDGITPRVNRLGGGVVFTRSLTRDPDKIPSAWVVSAGIQYQRISIRDDDFRISRFDELGNNLSFSGRGQDDLLTVQLGIARDRRDDPQTPTKGSVLRVGLDQSIPVGLGSITLTRLRASYSQFVPVRLLRFTKGPQVLAFNVQGGTVLGDLPPYEAFTLGGGSSVRGYDEGEVGSGRSYLQATAEYRFPLLKFLGGIGGVLFVDYGTLLGTQDNVPGSPGLVRGKPGDGLGYGVGLRVKTPIGPVRLDYGWTIDGGNRFQFGFGEKF
ncbi:MAG: BamA/TamA family outer membrane protein [Thermosynechococcaceae cyanobacterium MS004]|nr:BamA/TamA family outer membrane protein [Thermosynechococcaceae cyanobacterium MS004]